MADNNNLKEENSFYLDPNIQIKRSYSYTNYLLYNRSIDTQNNPINRKYIGQFVLGERLGGCRLHRVVQRCVTRAHGNHDARREGCRRPADWRHHRLRRLPVLVQRTEPARR